MDQRVIDWSRELDELWRSDPQEALDRIDKGAKNIAALRAAKQEFGINRMVIEAYLWNDQPETAFAVHQQYGDKGPSGLTVFLDQALQVADAALQAEGWRFTVESMLAFAKKKKLPIVERLQLKHDLTDEKTRDAALDRTLPELAKHKAKWPDMHAERYKLAKYCCRVAVEADDFQRAGAFVPFIAEDPVFFAEFKMHMKFDPVMQNFLKSPEFKGSAPVKPKNAVLAKAYDSVFDAPYDTYLKLERLKKAKTELLDVLAVQSPA